MKQLLFSLLLLLSVRSQAQCSDWQWATTDNGFERNECHGVRTDSQGNTYVAGWFDSDELTIGGVTIQNSVQGESGNGDIYVAKLDINGIALWAHSFGGTNSDWCWAMAIDSDGGVILTGEYFSATITFGTTILTNAGLSDIFIAKYDSDGNPAWALDAGTGGSDRGLGVDCDDANNVYVTGDFDGTAFFGIWPLASVNGSDDVFVVKLNAAGAVQWAHSYGGGGSDTGSEIAVDNNGSVFVCGWYYYDAFTFNGVDYALDDLGDSFLFSLTEGGSAVWCDTFGSDSNDLAQCLDVASNGDVVVCGDFFSSSLTIGNDVLTNSGNMDGFLARFESDGTALWAKKCVFSSQSDYASVCTVDIDGGIYVGGHAGNDPTNFGNGQSLAQEGWFVSKYDSGGNAIWVEGDGGDIPSFAAWDQVFGIGYAEGYLSVGGDFMSNELNFGDHSVTHTADFGMVQGFYAQFLGGSLPEIVAVTSQGAMCEGNELSLAVDYVSELPVTTQWYFGGDVLSGEMAAVLELGPLGPNDEGTYSCEVTNACGTVLSDGYFLDVLPPLEAPDPGQIQFCETGAPYSLPPGNWTGNGIFQNQFDPQIAGPGITVVSYNSIPEEAGDCIAYGSYQFTVFEQPDAGEDVEDTLCMEDVQTDLSELLSETAQEGGQWYDEVQATAISPQVDLSDYGTGMHTFYYVLDALEPCDPDTAVVSVLIEFCTGVKEVVGFGFELYPNPGTNELIVHTSAFGRLSLSDMMGREILKDVVLAAGRTVIHTDDLAAGTYLVRMGNSTRRWVKL